MMSPSDWQLKWSRTLLWLCLWDWKLQWCTLLLRNLAQGKLTLRTLRPCKWVLLNRHLNWVLMGSWEKKWLKLFCLRFLSHVKGAQFRLELGKANRTNWPMLTNRASRFLILRVWTNVEFKRGTSVNETFCIVKFSRCEKIIQVRLG